jgi:glycerol-3-phosphate dehydrogenase
MSTPDEQVAIVGGGVVGCALAYELAAHGVSSLLLEAEDELALGASGANSGILHTGFDSKPGELETELILRAARMREEWLRSLGAPVLHCGARLRATGPEQSAAVAQLAENAARNGVDTELLGAGELRVPGEAVTDPAVFARALAAGAAASGSTVRTGARVSALGAVASGGVEFALASGERLRVRAAANCAGVRADEVAALAGERPFGLYPRKGEFLVFEQPGTDPLREILLALPSAAGKGVLVFPTVDGHLIAGPTARERTDKDDRSVEPDAAELILERARRSFPPLEGIEPIAAYAGLRPAGADGANYVLAHSSTVPALVHAGAIRSTGLTAAPALAERLAGMLADTGAIELGAARTLPAAGPTTDYEPWWQRAARLSSATGGP